MWSATLAAGLVGEAWVVVGAGAQAWSCWAFLFMLQKAKGAATAWYKATFYNDFVGFLA